MAKGERGTTKPYLRGKLWWIKYYVPGEDKPRYESSKSTNKNDAIRLLNQRRSEIDNRQVSSTTAIISDLLADRRKQGRHSYKQAAGYVRLHLDPALGKIKASGIATRMIDRFIEQKQNAGYANATINRWLEALRRVFTLALNSLPLLAYISPKIEMLEEGNVREGFLEHDDYLRFRGELPDHQRLILVIGYHLGMRRGEILKLRWTKLTGKKSLSDWNGNRPKESRREWLHCMANFEPGWKWRMQLALRTVPT